LIQAACISSRNCLYQNPLCLLHICRQGHLSPTVMVNGFKDLEGSVQSSGLPVCQYTVQRSKAISRSISFALAVFPMVRRLLSQAASDC
jgi:hypothetical protein